jgi:hypothetical protein
MLIRSPREEMPSVVAGTGITTPFLYSAGRLVKFHLCSQYLSDEHYVWCSDCFDARHHYLHSGPIDTPASSHPAEIFERLRAATDSRQPDWHDPSIASWKLNRKSLAAQWKANAHIDHRAEQGIIFLLDRAEIVQWRPLIYIIHREKVAPRLIPLDLSRRASLEMEYIIEDLRPDEFDVISP